MTMRMRPTEYPHIFWNEDKNLPCISGTRLRVQDVVAHHLHGRLTPEEIAASFSSVTLADIYSALAYYYDHREEMDRLMAEHERSMEEWQAEWEAEHGPSPLRQKLKAMSRLP